MSQRFPLRAGRDHRQQHFEQPERAAGGLAMSAASHGPEQISPLAGKPAPDSLLTDIPKLVTAYYSQHPVPSEPTQRVVFGTSGHRGSSLRLSFNEAHVLAITQAICLYRRSNEIDGPLFLGWDTHALSEPARISVLEVLSANRVEVMVDVRDNVTPTPVISHSILTYNRGRTTGLADGIVITPSHNPPDYGGIKYDPPSGGPADTSVTGWIQDERERASRGRPARRGTYSLGACSTGGERAPLRLSGGLCRRSPECDRHGRAAEFATQHRDRPSRRRESPVLGGHRRTVRASIGHREPSYRPDFSLHDRRPGRRDPDGSVVQVRHGATHRRAPAVRSRMGQ